MSCDPMNRFVNVNGPMTLEATRPLWAFFAAPWYPVIPHSEKPAGDKPPPNVIPPGPQAIPGTRPIGGVMLPRYAPGTVDDGWVPGGNPQRFASG